MLPGPIFNVELLTSARRTRYFFIRAMYATVLLVALGLVYQSWSWTYSLRGGKNNIHAMAELSAAFFGCFAVAATAGRCVARAGHGRRNNRHRARTPDHRVSLRQQLEQRRNRPGKAGGADPSRRLHGVGGRADPGPDDAAGRHRPRTGAGAAVITLCTVLDGLDAVDRRLGLVGPGARSGHADVSGAVRPAGDPAGCGCHAAVAAFLLRLHRAGERPIADGESLLDVDIHLAGRGRGDAAIGLRHGCGVRAQPVDRVVCPARLPLCGACAGRI